jgi:nitrile hydratase accessory protein
MADGEPVFAEPWEARAYGLALELVEQSGRPWSDFRDRLIEAIGESNDRPYFESWVVALERLAATAGVTADDLHHERIESAAYHYSEDGVPIEVTPLALSPDRLRAACGPPFGDPSHTQTELYRMLPEGMDGGESFGVRAFDATGGMTTRTVDRADWLARRDELLSF